MSDKTKRGGNRGGGTTPRRVTLSTSAARHLRQRAQLVATERYTSEAASEAASAIIEAHAAGRLVLVTDDMRAALPWLEQARQQCFNEDARRGLDQIIAALWRV